MIPGLIIVVVALAIAGSVRAGLTSALRTTRADALREAAEGTRGAGRIAELLEQRESLQPSVNAIQSLLLLTAVAPAVWLATRGAVGPSVIGRIAVPVFVCWLVGDLLARWYGRTKPGRLAFALAPLLVPVVKAGSAANRFVVESNPETEEVTSENGTPEDEEEREEERELIDSVLEFTDTIVREVMVPRQDMVTIPADATVAELAAFSSENGYSRYPVTNPGGEVVGLVLTKDVLGAHAGGQEVSDLSAFLREVPFVPENKRASDLLREMQGSKTHLAMVVDEYGDITGLVSIEDLLEELVGEIADEHDAVEELLEPLEDGAFRVDGRLEVHSLGEAFSVQLPDDEWDTVAGLVLGLAGRVPEEGERFEINGLELEVDRLQGRRVSSVLARRS